MVPSTWRARTRSGISCWRSRMFWRTRRRTGRAACASPGRCATRRCPRWATRGPAPPWRRSPSRAPAPELLFLGCLLRRDVTLAGFAFLIKADRHLNLGLAALAQQHDPHALADGRRRDDTLKVTRPLERCAVDGDEDVIGLHTAHRRRLTGHHAAYEDAASIAEFETRHIFVRHLGDRHAEPPPLDLALGGQL